MAYNEDSLINCNLDKMKKIGIFSKHNIKNAYSCLIYLKEILLSKNQKVDLWAFAKNQDLPPEKRNHFYSFEDRWYGKIRRIRLYLADFDAYIQMKKYDVIIINDLDFFIDAYRIKNEFPEKKIIHYNTEIHGADVKYPKKIVEFYEKHADFPEMIIDCLKERAKWRQKKFHITKNIYVINNTLPLHEIPDNLMEKDVRKYFTFEKNLPILVYAGGCDLSRSLGDIIDSSALFEGKLNYLFFCYGKKKNLELVKKIIERHPNCRFFEAIDRKTLFAVMNQCDIGVQYYNPQVSINHYYASPSKLFEYMACGLNILSSNNRGIDKIIEDNDIGVCFTIEDGIAGGIRKLLAKGLSTREHIKDVFEKKYCYEIDSKDTIDEIQFLVNSSR